MTASGERCGLGGADETMRACEPSIALADKAVRMGHAPPPPHLGTGNGGSMATVGASLDGSKPLL